MEYSSFSEEADDSGSSSSEEEDDSDAEELLSSSEHVDVELSFDDFDISEPRRDSSGIANTDRDFLELFLVSFFSTEDALVDLSDFTDPFWDISLILNSTDSVSDPEIDEFGSSNHFRASSSPIYSCKTYKMCAPKKMLDSKKSINLR